MFSLRPLAFKLADKLDGLACLDPAIAIWLTSSGGSQVLREAHSNNEALACAPDGLPHPAEARAQRG